MLSLCPSQACLAMPVWDMQLGGKRNNTVRASIQFRMFHVGLPVDFFLRQHCPSVSRRLTWKKHPCRWLMAIARTLVYYFPIENQTASESRSMANSTSRSVALLMYFSHNGFYSKILCSVAAAGVSLSNRLYFLHEILLVLTTAVLMVRKLGIPILLRIRECRTVTSSWNMWEVRYVTKS